MKIIKKIVIINLLIVISLSSFAQLERVQAAFIYNFTKYMEWPAESRSGDFIIGVINGPEMVSALNAMVSGKLVGTQKINVKTFTSVSSVTNCHLVYLPSSLSGELGALTSKIGSKSTGIITCSNGLAQKGSDINFVIVGDKQGFELNRGNIKKKGITVNSRLEQLAAKVY